MENQKKRMTREQKFKSIEDTFKKKLKEIHIKGLIQGGEINSKMILDMIDNSKTLDDIKHFCEVNLHKNAKETMEKLVLNKKENK